MLSPMLPRGRWAEGKPLILAVQMTGQELDSFLLPPSPGFLSLFHLCPDSTFNGQRGKKAGAKNLRRQRGRGHWTALPEHGEGT